MKALALDDDGVDPPALGATGHSGETPGTLTLDGREVPCRSLADGTKRLTIADLDGDRLVYVLTDGIETEPLRLATLAELPSAT